MKIGGVYILSRRSIARMLATITAALMMFYAAATTRAEAIVHRIHNAAIALHSLDLQMVGRLARTVVPDFIYLEYKSLYLELKPFRDSQGRIPPIAAARSASAPYQNGQDACGRDALPRVRNGQDARCPSIAPVTKADLRAAVKTILRGEDVNAAKPGPRVTAAKRRQIEAAEAYRKSHAGCTLHNACIKSFVAAKGGYNSAKVMYEYLRLQQDSKSSKN